LTFLFYFNVYLFCEEYKNPNNIVRMLRPHPCHAYYCIVPPLPVVLCFLLYCITPPPLSYWLIVTFRSKSSRRVCVAIYPGERATGLRPRFGSRRCARGAVLPGRVALPRSSSRRRACAVVPSKRASPSITIPDLAAAGTRAWAYHPGAHRHPRTPSRT